MESLTEIEISLIRRMPKKGNFGELDSYLRTTGLYDEWGYLFEQYAALALDGSNEALKRALFFVWYQCSEPCQFSGLFELNEPSCKKILKQVNLLAERKSLDDELTFMLPYYFEVCGWYFERFEELNSLLGASVENGNLWQTESKTKNWKDRGLMGGYWSTIGL